MPTPPAKPSPPSLEIDPRLPSGKWVGFWLQRPNLKGKMELLLTFQQGLIKGEGRDLVGQFTMLGRYEVKSGRVTMHKGYVGQHALSYDGWAEERLGIWGVWRLSGTSQRGGWHIWPKGMPDPTGSTLKAAVEAPVGVGEGVGSAG